MWADWRHTVALTVALTIGAVALVYPPFATDLNLRVMTQALLLAYLAQCWNIAGGYAGQFSLGHAAFFGVGGYASTLLFVRLGVSPWLGMCLGAVLAGLLAGGVSMITFRYRVKGTYFALFTLAFATVVQSVVYAVDALGGPNGILLPLDNSWERYLLPSLAYYYIILVMVVAVALVTRWLERHRIGRFLVSIREDELAAEASGVDTARWKMAAMALSGFLVALGGTFDAQYFRYASPDTMLSFDPTMNMLLGTMVGGAGTVLGPVAGAVIFNFLSELLRSMSFLAMGTRGAVATTSIYAVVLILTMLYMPGGLARLVGNWLRRPRREGKAGADQEAEPAEGALDLQEEVV